MDYLTLVAWYGHTRNRERLLDIKEGSHNLKAGEYKIDGVRWIITKSGEAYGDRKVRFHRVLVECPLCLRVVSAGRIHQHAEVHGITRAACWAECKRIKLEGKP